ELSARPDVLAPACWAARGTDGLAGFVLTTAGESAATLQMLAVRRDVRRSGIGRALLERAVDAARERALEELRSTMVDTADEPACAFFRALGWEEEDTGSLRMRRDLGDLSDLPAGAPAAEGYLVRTFREEDAAAWVRVRNAAFATEGHSSEPW